VPAFWLLHAGAAGTAALIIVVLWKPLTAALVAEKGSHA